MKSSAERNAGGLTSSQQEAVTTRGNVLVMAGAGTGKTRALVARCLDGLCREGVSLDEILVVTFTEAAAAEMKQRLRRALEAESQKHPGADRCAEQLALFDTAHIGTLHSFCFQLVRGHFYELGLDPQSAVADEGQARLLAAETLDEELQACYAGEDEFSAAVQNLIRIYGAGRDRSIRELVLRLHHYAQTRPDADAWLARQIEEFCATEPTGWRGRLLDAIQAWSGEWPATLESLRAENVKAAECFDILQKRGSAPASGAVGDAPAADPVRREGAPNGTRGACAPPLSSEAAAEVLAQILAADAHWPAKRKTALRKPLEDFFDDALFLRSLAAAGENDPLAEDWGRVRPHMTALLRLTRNFSTRFAARKRDEGLLDFHDLEQFALKLLWDFGADGPTPVAARWREKLRCVFVDEYQDINAAQDKIIQALSRENLGRADTSAPGSTRPVAPEESRVMPPGSEGSRFLVGDVKQSIYRFRLAEPKIFRGYARRWRGQAGRTILLADNFRSRESLLNFVNSLFGLLMREEIGGVNYDDEARLKFGLPETRAPLSAARNPAPRAELLLRFKGNRAGASDVEMESGAGDLAELQDAEREARLLALRLKALNRSGHEIWDETLAKFRPADWRDLAVLLRSPSGKAEIYAKEFERAGVPLVVERGGFYDSSEILDLLSLLQLLDNPLQDVPLIAVLRSPLVGLSLDELAQIRLDAGGHFWFALIQVQSPKSGVPGGTRRKVDRFLERFAHWRTRARVVSLSQCLEEILAETHYAEWLQNRPRGRQRRANVTRFLNLAQRFDQFQRQGLFRFLKFIEAQREAAVEPDVAPAAEENAVRLMSIHQSKGLEFPVVAIADLGRRFNELDLRSDVILDEELGLCPRVQPPEGGGRYPSLLHWLAQKNQHRELRGEELRLLYVAATRARDTLILTGSVAEKKWKTFWTEPGAVTTRDLLSAKSFADWIGLWFKVQCSKFKAQGRTEGEWPDLRWRIAADAESDGESSRTRRDGEAENKDPLETPDAVAGKETIRLDDAMAGRLRAMLAWHYPHLAAARRAAKTSVTALRRQADELDEEAEPGFSTSSFQLSSGRRAPAAGISKGKHQNPTLSAAEAGTATHRFLRHLALERATGLASLATEADRLERGGVLSADERAVLDLEGVAAFWNSEFGRQIRARATDVQRELAFTARFSPGELDGAIGTRSGTGLETEFVVVQGAADLVVLLKEEIWLVDFKTDEVHAGRLSEKVKIYEPQLRLYARALEKIYSRPVKDCRLYFLRLRQTAAVEISD